MTMRNRDEGSEAMKATKGTMKLRPVLSDNESIGRWNRDDDALVGTVFAVARGSNSTCVLPRVKLEAHNLSYLVYVIPIYLSKESGP